MSPIKIAAFILFALLIGLTFFFPTNTYAATLNTEWKGTCVYETTPGNTLGNVATIQGIQCLVANVLGVAVTLIGLAAFVIFIISSFQILLSGGNSKGVEAAKGSMTYAVVGLVVALSAFIILGVLSQFTGIDFTVFRVPGPSFNPSTP
jgi:hypothetical protein